jgi:ubiquitin carboxyl-terminal hydrolase 7
MISADSRSLGAGKQLTRRLAEYESQSLYTTIPQFYDFLQNRVLVQFKPRHEENPGRTQDFDLMLSKKMTYDVVCPYSCSLPA